MGRKAGRGVFVSFSGNKRKGRRHERVAEVYRLARYLNLC